MAIGPEFEGGSDASAVSARNDAGGIALTDKRNTRRWVRADPKMTSNRHETLPWTRGARNA
jgi:hypothetical protein